MKASDLKRNPVEEAIKEHIARGVPFSECMFRPGSEAFTEFYTRVREMRESLDLDWQDQELLDTNIGECIMIEGERIPLDCPLIEIEEEKKTYYAIATKSAKSKSGWRRVPDTRFDTKQSADRYGDKYHTDKYGAKMYKVVTFKEEVELDEAFNLDIGTKVAMKSNGKMIYGKVIGKEKVMGKPGVEVKWSSGGKGRFSNDQFAALSMDKKADYVISESVELDEVTVANAAKAFDIKKQAVALKAKIAKLKNTPGDAAHMKMIDAKRSFDKKIAALQALDVDAYEIKKLKESSLDEAEYQGRKVKLNSPKRGGPKKFYVYVKNPKTGRVKKISWGDTTGLSVKSGDRDRVRSFVARHKCKQANDKMTARYWSCRTPRYKALGVKGGAWW